MPTNNTDTLMDIRERIVRIETMLSGCSDHGARITQLETEATKLRTSIRFVQWFGAFIVAAVTFAVDHAGALFR